MCHSLCVVVIQPVSRATESSALQLAIAMLLGTIGCHASLSCPFPRSATTKSGGARHCRCDVTVHLEDR